jgi:hypothetical protein
VTDHPLYTRWPVVEGYCWPQSVDAGQPVALHCASRGERFGVEVALITDRRTVMWRSGELTAPEVTEEAMTQARAWADGCHWPVTATIDTDRAWPSGFYEVQLHAIGDGAGVGNSVGPGPQLSSEAFFVVRPHRNDPAPGLLVLATNTWNAYNQWGGRGLYRGADRVSFARPLERGYLRRPAAPDEVDFDGRIANVDNPSDPTHQRLQDYQAAGSYPLLTASSGWHNWERRFVRWATGAGFRFDVAISQDLAFRPEVLEGHRMLASVGHDEYWSWEMRDNVDGWVDGGGNWAVLSGNTCFWQVRYEDDEQTMVCHKGRARFDDPVMAGPDRSRLTSMWSDPLVGRPETTTTGLTFTRGGYHRVGLGVPNGSGAYTIHRPDHWALTDTGLQWGDQLGAGSFVVGYEVDGCAFETIDGLPQPTGEDGAPTDLEIIGTAPARLLSITEEVCEAPEGIWASVDPPGDLEGTAMILFGDAEPHHVAKLAHGHAVMGAFRRGRGTVFNAGTADWAYGLDTDPLVQQVTANVVRHLGGVGDNR